MGRFSLGLLYVGAPAAHEALEVGAELVVSEAEAAAAPRARIRLGTYDPDYHADCSPRSFSGGAAAEPGTAKCGGPVSGAGRLECGIVGLMDAPGVGSLDAVDAESFNCGDELLYETWML